MNKQIEYSAQEINDMLGEIPAMKETISTILDTLTIAVAGSADIRQAGAYQYTLSYGLSSEKNVELVSVDVSCQSNLVQLKNVTNLGFTLNVAKIPLDQERIEVKVTAKEKHSGVTTFTQAIMLTPTPVTAFTIEGADSIGVGDFEYTLNTTPENANVGIKEINVEIINA